MAAQVVVSPSEAALAQIVVDLADSLDDEIDPGFKVIADAGVSLSGTGTLAAGASVAYPGAAALTGAASLVAGPGN